MDQNFKLSIPDDVMMVLVKRSIRRNNTHAQLHGYKHEFGSLEPNPGFGDVRPIGGQKSQDTLRTSRSHAASDGQCH